MQNEVYFFKLLLGENGNLGKELKIGICKFQNVNYRYFYLLTVLFLRMSDASGLIEVE